MKKVFSLLLVLVLVLMIGSSVFAGEKGKYITEERITQEYVPGVEEVAEWKMEVANKEYSNKQFPVTDKNWKIEVKIDALEYNITAKYGDLAKLKTKGTFEEIEGKKEIKLKGYGENYLTFTFNIFRKIITPGVEEIPEIKTLYYIGYEYEKCKVMFNKDLELINIKELNKKKPFIPNKSKVWTGKLWNKVFLYKAADWECVSEISPEITPEISPEITPENTPEITPEETTVDTPEVEEVEEEIEEVETGSGSELPKTGETHPFKIIIVGILICGAGIVTLLKLKN